jgi:hypothetical protein
MPTFITIKELNIIKGWALSEYAVPATKDNQRGIIYGRIPQMTNKKEKEEEGCGIFQHTLATFMTNLKKNGCRGRNIP